MNVRKGFARLARVTAITYGVVAVMAVGITAFGAWQIEGAGLRQFRIDVSASGEPLGVCQIRYDDNGYQLPCGRSVELPSAVFMVPYDATVSESDRAIRFAAEQEINRRERVREGVSTARSEAIASARERVEAGLDAAASGERLFVAGGSASTQLLYRVPPEGSLRPHQAPHIWVWAGDAQSALTRARSACIERNLECGASEDGASDVAPSILDRVRYVLSEIWQPALILLGVYLALWVVFRAMRYVALGFMDKTDVSK